MQSSDLPIPQKGLTVNCDESEGRGRLLRTAQVIVGALIAGVVFFAAVLFVVLRPSVQPLDGGTIVSGVMALFACAAAVAGFFVPGLFVRESSRKIAEGTWQSNMSQSSVMGMQQTKDVDGESEGDGNTPRSSGPIRDADEGKLHQVYLVKTIIGAALLEGGAFAALMAFLLEGQVYSVVLAGLLLLGIAFSFPTRTRLTDWLEQELRHVQEFRKMNT